MIRKSGNRLSLATNAETRLLAIEVSPRHEVAQPAMCGAYLPTIDLAPRGSG